MITFGLTGASGRMGRTLIRLAQEAKGVRLGAACDRAGSPAIGEDAGAIAGLKPLGVRVTRTTYSKVLAYCH